MPYGYKAFLKGSNIFQTNHYTTKKILRQIYPFKKTMYLFVLLQVWF